MTDYTLEIESNGFAIGSSGDSAQSFTSFGSSIVSVLPVNKISYDRATLRKLLIGRNPQICGGDPYIIGTRISVANIIEKTNLHKNIHQIREEYPHLSSEQIYACLEYYQDHKAEIDDLLEQEILADES